MKELVTRDGKSSFDLGSSYYRNEKLFQDGNFVGARFAERYDGVIDRVPRSSYFPLFSESEGLPIAFRVADGLQRVFQTLTQKTENSNLSQCHESLRQARLSVGRSDWLLAVGQAAQAFRLGTSIEKQHARNLLEQMADEVKTYSHFAPAPRKNVLYTDYGEIPVAAYLSLDDAERYTMILNGGKNSRVTSQKETSRRAKVNRYSKGNV